MSQAKPEKPVVTTYSDHEVIALPNKLRGAASQVASAHSEDDLIARAEQALAALSPEFSGWMDSEIERLESARRNVREAGFTKSTKDALFHAAHDIRGEAATFGHPSVAAVADSLCRLIEHTPDILRVPLELVDQHVDAVGAIVRGSTRPDAADLARALTRKLREVTEEFLQYENRHRPDYLASIDGPTLVPNE